MSSGVPRALEVIGSYLHGYEAHLARARLEDDGLSAWLLDEHQVGMQWHLAPVLGGVKVAVRREDADRARALLDEDRSAELTGIAESDLPASRHDVCPRCLSERVAFVQVDRTRPLATLGALIQGLIGAAPPRPTAAVEGRCSTCAHVWRRTRA